MVVVLGRLAGQAIVVQSHHEGSGEALRDAEQILVLLRGTDVHDGCGRDGVYVTGTCSALSGFAAGGLLGETQIASLSQAAAE